MKKSQKFSAVPEDCTPRCRSQRHAAEAIACVLQFVEERDAEKVKVYLRQLCWNFWSVTDFAGRNVLHVACSAGCTEIVRWLLEVYGCDPNKPDEESGWSSVHRAAYSGHLEVLSLLIKSGGDFHMKDKQGVTPSDIIVDDRPGRLKYAKENPGSIFIWGTDENLSLGLGTQKITPEPREHQFLDFAPIMKHVSLQKYHSIFQSSSGRIWLCGHGLGGRLGMGDERSCLIPQEIPQLKNQDFRVKEVAAAQDHTLFLDSNGLIYSCGSNSSHQLGHVPTPQKLLEPCSLNQKTFIHSAGEQIQRVSAGRYHSVLATDQAVYTWGLNAGQLGHPKQGDKLVTLPRRVAALIIDPENSQGGDAVSMMGCSEGATGVVTSEGDVYILHEYAVKKIVSRIRDIVKIVVIGGNVDAERLPEDFSGSVALRVLLLNGSGEIFLWEGKDLIHSRVCLGRNIWVADLDLSTDSDLFCISKYGEGYRGKLGPGVPNQQDGWLSKGKPRRGQRSSLRRDCSQVATVTDLQRLPNIHRASSIACDPSGKRICVFQDEPTTGVEGVFHRIERSPQIAEDFERILETDQFSDLVVECCGASGSKTFDLHAVIVASRCDFVRKSITTPARFDNIGRSVVRIEADILDFAKFIKSAYRGERISQTDKGAADLARKLKYKSTVPLDRESFSDIKMKTSDGTLLKAHRCILSARCDYFRGMLAAFWMESQADEFDLSIDTDILQAVLEFLYTDKCTLVENSCDIDYVCSVLIVADQFLLTELKGICETNIIARMLRLDNVCELFQLSSTYQTQSLIQVCAEFICVNLTALIETKLLDTLTADSLEKLSLEYKMNICDASCRANRPPAWSSERLSRFESIYEDLKEISTDHCFLKSAGEKIDSSPSVDGKHQSRNRRRSERVSFTIHDEAKIDTPEKVSQPIEIPSGYGESFPSLGDAVLSTPSPPRPRIKSGSFKKKRLPSHSEETTPIKAFAWNISETSGKGCSDLERILKAEAEHFQRKERFSLDKADAEDKAIADLMVVYEVGYNPDERVTICRVYDDDDNLAGPVWAKDSVSINFPGLKKR